MATLEPIRPTATTTSLIETFRSAGRQMALVTDEYGDVQGLVTDSDFLGAIVGEIGAAIGPGGVVADQGQQRQPAAGPAQWSCYCRGMSHSRTASMVVR